MQEGQQEAVQADGDTPLFLHASTVALGPVGVLIRGASGRGKSSLALQLIALGAGLVADDRTCLWRRGTDRAPELIADAPEVLRGRIEARGVGILRAASVGPCQVGLVIDLDRTETERLPPFRRAEIMGIGLPLLHNVESPAFPAAIVQYLSSGRMD